MCNSDKIIVELEQIHNGFAGQHYLPYSIGILQAHVLHNSKKKERYDFKPTIYKRELLNDCVKKLKKIKNLIRAWTVGANNLKYTTNSLCIIYHEYWLKIYK